MKKQMLALTMAVSLGMLAGCSPNSDTASTTAAQTTKEDSGNKGAEENTGEDTSASTWPGSTVQLYVPASAGGGTDMIARLFAQGMSDATGGSFVVVNDGTGGGTVAMETIRNAKPDGLNLYLGHTGQCGMMATGQYDHSYHDFQMLGTITVEGVESNAICVNKDVPFDTFQEFVEEVKANPGKYLTGVQSNGNRHFMQLLLQDATGTEFTIVDCGGVADTITNLVGGMVDMAILPINNASQYVESGDLKALAITGNNKSLLLPDVPTMKECGFESCEIPSISVLVGPQGMSQDDVTKINAVMKEVLENPDIVEKYNQMAMTAGYHTVEEAVAIVDEMQEKYNKAAEMMN